MNLHNEYYNSETESFRKEIRSAVFELTKDNLFRLSLILVDQQSFGNQLVLLVSDCNVNIRYIKERFDFDFWCGIKYDTNLKMLFSTEHESEYYLEGTTNITDELELSTKSARSIISSVNWFDLETLLSVIGINIKIERRNFIEYIKDTSSIIRMNIDLINQSFNEANREKTIESMKLEVARANKEFFEANGLKLTDLQLKNLLKLGDIELD
jgi:hypothetical protein